MKVEELQEKYEQETGKKWWTNPVCHGEVGFASWEYQKWLETGLTEANSEVNVEAVVRLPKIEIDKLALRFVFTNGDGANLFWRDLFMGQHHKSFQNLVMEFLQRLYNECIENNIEPNLEEDEAT